MDINYIAVDMIEAMLGLSKRNIETSYNFENPENLYLIRANVERLTDVFESKDLVERIYINFCNPWPKKKHHKRRLMQRPRTNLLTQKLYEGGYVYMATDWEPYAEFALEELNLTSNLKNKYEGFAPHQEWRPETKFEHKGLLAERKICELFFEKTEE